MRGFVVWDAHRIVLSGVKQIEVFKSFVLHITDGCIRKFEVGIHNVEESIANHWYTLLHSRVVPELEKAAQEVETAATSAVEEVVESAAEAVAQETETAVEALAKKASKSVKKAVRTAATDLIGAAEK